MNVSRVFSALLLLASMPSAPIAGQQPDVQLALLPGQLAHGGPRFLLARKASTRVPLDVSRTTILSQRLDLDLDSITTREAIMIVARKAKLELGFSDHYLPLDGRVRLQARSITVAAAFTDVLLDKGIDVIFTETGSAVLVRRPDAETLPAGTIDGKVTDPAGIPLARATVTIEGTNLGAVTRDDGSYRIAQVVVGTHTMVARRIGYVFERRVVTIDAENQTVVVDFVLQPSPTALDQVVVTGTAGGEQRRSIGNVVTTIDAVEALGRSGATNVTALLGARAPGVILTSSTGRPGSGATIQIRGRSTMSLSQEPLIYIDGVRVSNDMRTGPSGGLGANGAQSASRLNDINPEDIESIEVIKGPAAATIYGTEAANGVLQIITRKGSAGEAQWAGKIERGFVSFRDPEGRIPTNYALNPSGDLVPWNPVQQEEERGTPLFRNGAIRSQSASVSGGVLSSRYYVTASYDDTEGVEKNNSQRRFSGHINLNVAPSEKVDLAANLNIVKGASHLGSDGLSAMLVTTFGHPLSAFTNPPLGTALNRGFFVAPPEVSWELHDNLQKLSRFTSGVQISHRPATWYKQRLGVGLDITSEDNQGLERFAPPDLATFFGTPLNPSPREGQLTQTLRSLSFITGDYSGTASFTLTPSITSNSSIGAQFYRRESNQSSLSGRRFPGPNVETISGLAERDFPTQSVLVNTTIGFYAQQQAGWNDRMFVTAALRVDNNSAFGEDFKWVTYPKVSATWVISEEPFWTRLTDVISTLKLRTAYGQSGQQPDAFAALQTFSPVVGPGGANAVSPGSFGNPNLKPERGSEVEVGFDAAFLDRVNLDFTYFRKQTRDGILSQPLAPSSGFPGSQVVNIAETRNSGVELQARVKVLSLPAFGWDVTGSIGTNDGRIESMGDLPFINAGAGNPSLQRHQVGYPIGAFFTRRVVTADRHPTTGLAINILCDGGPGAAPVACSQAPFVFLGTPTPKVVGALSNGFTIGKQLQVHALVDFKRGHRLFNFDEQQRCVALRLCRANFRPEEFSVQYLGNIAPTSMGQGAANLMVQDASFTRLRELSATYTLPEQWVRHAAASGASFTISGRNLALWTDYNGIDPETRLGGGIAATSQAPLPLLAQFLASLRVTF